MSLRAARGELKQSAKDPGQHFTCLSNLPPICAVVDTLRLAAQCTQNINMAIFSAAAWLTCERHTT